MPPSATPGRLGLRHGHADRAGLPEPPVGGASIRWDPRGGSGAPRARPGQSQSGIRSTTTGGLLPNTPDSVGIIDGVPRAVDVGSPRRSRTPLPVPVIKLLSDFEAVDDGVDPADLDPNLRLWEVAGSAHADHWIGYQSVFGMGPRLAGGPPMARAQHDAVLHAAGNYGEQIVPTLATCVVAGAGMLAATSQRSTSSRGVPTAVRPRQAALQFERGQLASKPTATPRASGCPDGRAVAKYLSTACALADHAPFTDPSCSIATACTPRTTAYGARRRRGGDGWLLPEDASPDCARCVPATVLPPTADPCAPSRHPRSTRAAAAARPHHTGRPAARGARRPRPPRPPIPQRAPSPDARRAVALSLAPRPRSRGTRAMVPMPRVMCRAGPRGS